MVTISLNQHPQRNVYLTKRKEYLSMRNLRRKPGEKNLEENCVS